MSLPQPLPNYSARPHSRAVDFILYRRDAIDLNAPYQRGAVWGIPRRQDLMRSMLMGLPIGAIVINRRTYDHKRYMAIIDGKQRIETLQAMADGEFGIPAVWVPERFRGVTVPIDYDGHTVDGVIMDSDNHPFMSILMNFPLATIEAEVATIEEEAEIFRLINSGGVPQTVETMAAAAAVEAGQELALDNDHAFHERCLIAPAETTVAQTGPVDVHSFDLPHLFAAVAGKPVEEVATAAFVSYIVRYHGHTVESARDGIYTLQDAGRLTITDRYALRLTADPVDGVCRECGRMLPTPRPRFPRSCTRCGSPALNPYDRYTGGAHAHHVAAFLRDFDQMQPGESFGDLAVKHMLPRDIVYDMTMTRLGYIVWREGQGFVLTDAGKKLADISTPR